MRAALVECKNVNFNVRSCLQMRLDGYYCSKRAFFSRVYESATWSSCLTGDLHELDCEFTTHSRGVTAEHEREVKASSYLRLGGGGRVFSSVFFSRRRTKDAAETRYVLHHLLPKCPWASGLVVVVSSINGQVWHLNQETFGGMKRPWNIGFNVKRS